MKKYIKKAVYKAAEYSPARLVAAIRYPREFLFDKNIISLNTDTPSVVFFTSNKTASKLMNRILRKINKEALKLTPLNLSGYIWNSRGDTSVQYYLAENRFDYFKDYGALYAPLRNYIDISHLQSAKVFAMLRDPRDQIVSSYARAHLHRPPVDPKRRKAFFAHQKNISQTSLEENVLQYAPVLSKRFENYRKVVPRENLLFYETLWSDPEKSIDEINRVLGVDLSPGLRRQILDMINEHFVRNSQDGKAQIRIGEPGEFRSYLSESAICQLTDIFSDHLKWMYDDL